MNEHDKRIGIFNDTFKGDNEFGYRLLNAEMIGDALFEKITNGYAYDLNHMTNKEIEKAEKRKEKERKKTEKSKTASKKTQSDYCEREDKPIVIGLYDKNSYPNGKKGILFTDYKFYYSFKRKKYTKIWYDEIKSIRTKFLNSKKIVIKTDDGARYVLKTNNRSVNRKIIKFVKQMKDYNEEICQLNYDKKFSDFENDESELGMAAGIEIGKRNIANTCFEEEKFHARQGHGFAAERANNMIDRLEGKRAEMDGDNNVKNGPDRHIKHINGNIEWIQTKYCKTANASVDSCFNKDGQFRYFDSANKPMSIEVPKDQYDQAIQVMEKKIMDGKVKGISDPAEASKIIRKGHITYKQAVNIAKAGTIDSIKYDAVNGIVASTSAFGISSVVTLATGIWNGDGVTVAIKNATCMGVKVGGASFLTSVIASQLSKAGLNSALVSSTESFTKMMGPKLSAAIANAFRSSSKAIAGGAAMKSAAKILRTNIITSLVAVIVFSLGDLCNLLRRRITIVQFLKNFIVLTLSIAASVIGGIGGAALGTLILPGFGSALFSIIAAVIAGALTSYLGRKLLGIFMKEDSDKMIEIIQDEFQEIAEDYLLSSNEAEKVIDKLTKKISLKTIRKMVASKDKHVFAKNLLIPITEHQVSKRKNISEPSHEIMIASINQLLDSWNEEGEMA